MVEASWGFNLLMGLNIFKEAFLIVLMFKIIKVLNIYINKNKEDEEEKNE